MAFVFLFQRSVLFRSGQNKSGLQAVGNKILPCSVLKGITESESAFFIEKNLIPVNFAKSRSAVPIYSVCSKAVLAKAAKIKMKKNWIKKSYYHQKAVSEALSNKP